VLDLCQCTGYFASVLVLATFAMRNMRLLRITAILSNIAFITYGVLYRLPPIIALHLLLLPINLVRLIELYRAGREDQRNQLPWAPRIVPVVLIGAGVVFACQLAAHAEGRAWIGVTVGDASHHEDLVKLGWFSGVPVLEVHADSPAASAGIRAGDIIVEIDGQSLVSADELICRIAARFPGSQARLTTVHGTEIRYISLKLGSWPGDSFPSLLHCPPSVSWQPTLGAYSMRAVTVPPPGPGPRKPFAGSILPHSSEEHRLTAEASAAKHQHCNCQADRRAIGTKLWRGLHPFALFACRPLACSPLA
jgi:hypothetical protein